MPNRLHLRIKLHKPIKFTIRSNFIPTSKPINMLVVHHLGHSQSDRVVWLCEELEIPYELKKYDRSPVLAPQAFKDLHPIGAAPVIQDGDVTLAESEACMEYIINIHGNGRLMVKPGEKNYADFLYWYHITNGTLQPTVGRIMAMNMSGVAKDTQGYKRYSSKVDQVLKFIDQRLSQVPWLAGEEFSAADIMIMFSFTSMREFCQLDLSEYTNILKYVERAVQRPGYKRYLQKGDPDIDISQLIKGPSPLPFPPLRAKQ